MHSENIHPLVYSHKQLASDAGTVPKAFERVLHFSHRSTSKTAELWIAATAERTLMIAGLWIAARLDGAPVVTQAGYDLVESPGSPSKANNHSPVLDEV